MKKCTIKTIKIIIKNIRQFGLEYETLDDGKSLDFLLMLPNSLQF
ncbi:hypothetical protein [Chryseobacterium sp. SC28]|nr:hypothetical protein [Chryseobacterium sp. SC28]